MTELNKAEQKLRNRIAQLLVQYRIAQLLAGRHHLEIESATYDANDIILLIKAAGWKSPEELKGWVKL